MAKRADNSLDKDAGGGESLQGDGEQRLLELLDELHELERFRREQLVLRELGSYFKPCLTRREVYAAVERFGPRLWPEATGAVYALHASERFLERVACWGEHKAAPSSLALDDCWAMRRAQPHGTCAADTELLCGHLAQHPVELAALCIPVITRGRALGLLHLQRLPACPEDLEDDATAPGMPLASMVAEDLGFALASISQQEVLREQSIRDALTGLFNRRFLHEFLERELARAGRKTQQLSLIVMDLDHFKLINDTFGHSAGDMVLQHVGQVLQAHVRKSDVACRIGGEEFSLLLAESSLPIAIQRAESIRRALHGTLLEYEKKKLGAVTASFGAAGYPDQGRTVEALFRAADEAMYHAKRAGRDRVVSAASLPELGQAG